MTQQQYNTAGEIKHQISELKRTLQGVLGELDSTYIMQKDLSELAGEIRGYVLSRFNSEIAKLEAEFEKL